MLFSFFIIPFLIIFHHFGISIAIRSVDDQMLIAFMRNCQQMQISEYSMQKYVAHLGIVSFMKNNWQCDKIANEFEEYERTECQKYRKYLDILYEYLYREYIGIPSVKPNFLFKEQIEIEGPIIYAVNCLAKISQFYFDYYWSKEYKYKLNQMFKYYVEPKLLNEKRLKYLMRFEDAPKLPINELILQLTIDTANEWQTNKSANGIIRQNFEENVQQMFKKAEERAKEEEGDDKINEDKYGIILNSKFNDQQTWTKDALFSEFVKGLAKNSERFLKMAKEYSNYFNQLKEKGNLPLHEFNYRMITFGLHKVEKMKKHMTHEYEAHFGIMHLMRNNWHCDKIVDKSSEFIRKVCQKYRENFGNFVRIFVPAVC